jgi:hypothetical protein
MPMWKMLPPWMVKLASSIHYAGAWASMWSIDSVRRVDTVGGELMAYRCASLQKRNVSVWVSFRFWRSPSRQCCGHIGAWCVGCSFPTHARCTGPWIIMGATHWLGVSIAFGLWILLERECMAYRLCGSQNWNVSVSASIGLRQCCKASKLVYRRKSIWFCVEVGDWSGRGSRTMKGNLLIPWTSFMDARVIVMIKITYVYNMMHG